MWLKLKRSSRGRGWLRLARAEDLGLDAAWGRGVYSCCHFVCEGCTAKKLYHQGTNRTMNNLLKINCRLRNKKTNGKKEAGESYAQVPLRYIFETYSHQRG